MPETKAPMKKNLVHDVLIQKIQEFGVTARDSRQVLRRLNQLLPDRINSLVKVRSRSGGSVSECQREVFISREYEEIIDEVIAVGSQGHESRIQYETHMMLFEARRTLRKFRAR
jgi:hypothetical protein